MHAFKAANGNKTKLLWKRSVSCIRGEGKIKNALIIFWLDVEAVVMKSEHIQGKSLRHELDILKRVTDLPGIVSYIGSLMKKKILNQFFLKSFCIIDGITLP